MIKLWLHRTFNEFGDPFTPFPLALYANQCGFDIEGPEVYTTLNSILNIHDAYSGLIGDGEQVVCERPTLNKLQSWLRDVHGINVECTYKQFAWADDDGFYCTIKNKDHFLEYCVDETYSKDYNICLSLGLVSGLDLVII